MEGNPLAKCPLKKPSDERNYLYLTDQYFIVKINGRLFSYDIDSILSLNFGKKNLLFPIVAGGLISSLSILAYISDFIHPWALLLLFISGIFLLFYGFVGTPALILNQKNNQDHYLLKDTTVHLNHFINFVNHYLRFKDIPVYYLIISNQAWQKALQDEYLTVKEPIELFTKLPKGDGQVILKVIMEDKIININYLPDQHNIGLIPCVTKNIPLRAVSKV